MLTESEKRRLEKKLYSIVKETIDESDFFNNNFMQYEKKSEDSNSSDSKESNSEHKSGILKVSDYKDMDSTTYGKLKSIVPILTATYDNDVNTYNLTHSQLAYEMYKELDPDTARSKFSQKVTGKKRFTTKEVNKLFNIISGKIA